MRKWFEDHPLAASLIIWGANIVFTLGGALVLSALLPGIPGYGRGLSQSLILVLIGAALVALLLAATGWWRTAGFVGPEHWRNLRLLVLPAVLLFLPFIRGVRVPPANELFILALGYTATAFFEEGIYRGAILGLMRPLGIWPAVIASSLLFGLAHLPNIALRGNAGLIGLQAFGAAVEGVGLAALRLRTRTIWPLIALHLFHDLFLQMGTLPVPMISAIYSTVLLFYGIYLLRPTARADVEHDQLAPREIAAA